MKFFSFFPHLHAVQGAFLLEVGATVSALGDGFALERKGAIGFSSALLDLFAKKNGFMVHISSLFGHELGLVNQMAEPLDDRGLHLMDPRKADAVLGGEGCGGLHPLNESWRETASFLLKLLEFSHEH